MKRIVLSITALLSLVIPSSAKRFAFGVEWGGGSPVVAYHSYSYKLDVGYRVSDKEWTTPAYPLAYANLKFGYMITPVLETALTIGYEGVSKVERVIPVTARLSVYPAKRENGGGFMFVGGGVMISENMTSRVTFGGYLGGGYRFRLSSVVGLELFLRLSINTRYPDLYDPDTEMKIPSESIYLNRMLQGAVSAGIGISF